MKVRQDFVTNSSSSSFIISTKSSIPKGYENSVDKIEQNTIVQTLEKLSYRLDIDDRITYEMEDEKLKEIGKFNDEQMFIIRLIQSEQLGLYIDLKERLEKGENIYHILVDRDWLYYQDVLCKFIDSAELIDKETDL